MAFTEQDLKNQKEEIARLADELSRLNSVFAEQKKALGIPETETVTVAESEVTPELRNAMADATERAKREGEARASQAKLSAGPSSTGGRSRRGAMRI
ncbi:hypothetical protein [uncultured Mailhella sp.]|uniref:hypothetical protein n=1 Tax=uncultured Mailhella sp. TaxID=1981031 RepID=UPI0025D82DCB|nr:hypothetical protein [uncultured Mailhella sp.]